MQLTARAGDACAIKRVYIVNGGEILGEPERETAPDVKVPFKITGHLRTCAEEAGRRALYPAEEMNAREVMESHNAAHQPGKTSWECGIARVCLIHFSVHFILADICLEGALHLLHVAAEVDPEAAFAYFFNGEAPGGEPAGYVSNVLIRGAEAQTELLGVSHLP